MTNAIQILEKAITEALASLYNIQAQKVILQKTRKEFEGDYTLTTFNYTKESKKKPEELGEEIGTFLRSHNPQIAGYNVVKGFLNIHFTNSFWANYLNETVIEKYTGYKKPNSTNKTILLEYSSPNTNKPLHLGHIRNNLLGYSVAEILKANGNKVIKTNIVNDRGIHICKSMIAWQKFGNGETPQSSGLKGDHLVGKYYVEFDKAYKKQISELVEKGLTKEEAEKKAPLMLEAQEMLLKWEQGDKDVITLWETMNSWVYSGFDVTYKTLGVDFDKIYYESQTYILGKDIVKEGLDKNVFYKKEDGSARIDLTADGLDEKVVLRSDGTSVYITQDIGTAVLRFKDFPDLTQAIYTVGNEQDYHFKVLFIILDKLGYKWAKECYHLSYGMVELPEGKMKSREGTVVDADDLLQEMFSTSKQTTQELGKVEGFSEADLNELYKTIGLGALKYFMLKVDPKKKMLFDPKESIDFNGHTGPFIQYTHARIKSIIRKAKEQDLSFEIKANFDQINELERDLIKYIYEFEQTIEESSRSYNPAIIANFIYELTKTFNRYYHDHSILKEENKDIQTFRLALISQCATIISNGMHLLGIKVPEKM
ncbi:MAG: arginine--tRNA ligase [Sphingobacteriaceae bacterium]